MRLIFLSGPSGGGKTTLLDILKSGSLSPQLGSLFPPDVEAWRIVDITNRLRRDIERKGAAAVWPEIAGEPGVILHYDIVTAARSRLNGYAADPAFRLLDGRKDIQFLFVRTEPSRLLQQFSQRYDQRLNKKPLYARIWNRWARPPLEKQLYSDPSAIERIYADWLAFVQPLTGTHGCAPLTTLEPVTAPGTPPDFAIVAATDATAPASGVRGGAEP